MCSSIISDLISWYNWRGAEEELQKQPTHNVIHLTSESNSQESKRKCGADVVRSSFSPLRLLTLTCLFWGALSQHAKPFPAQFELSSLDGTYGFIINGKVTNDWSGYLVSSAGDMNGDGFSDIVIGAREASPSSRQSAGKSFVIYGSRTLLSNGKLELSSIDGINGFILNGEATYDYSGDSVSTAGDMNGDGLSDLVIGASSASPSGRSLAGKSYVIYGSRNFLSNGTFELSSLNGTNGFIINGEVAGDRSGISVSTAGDMNGDGLSDLVIGAYWASPSGKSKAGKCYVIYGNRTPLSGGMLELSSLSGINGFIFNGEVEDDNSGYSVSLAGDMNGDDLSDLVIGAYWASPSGRSKAGKSYVIYGNRTPLSSGMLELSNLDGTNGFILSGEDVDDNSGISVSSGGDINGDGLDDLVIGATLADPIGKPYAGKSYVIYGSRTPLSSDTFELSSLNGTNGFIINGEALGDRSGFSVSSAGDMNGDGFSDLVIGAQNAGPSGKSKAGKSYVIYGSRTPIHSDTLELSSLDGTNGFILIGEVEDDRSGFSVSSAGDLNGDGFSDLVIGANFIDDRGIRLVGKGYVIYGRNSTSSQHSSSITLGTNPFATTSQITQLQTSLSSTVSSTMILPFSEEISTILPTTTPNSLNLANASTSSSTSIQSNTISAEDTSPSTSLPLIVGIATAVSALSCSLLGGIVFTLKKRSGGIGEASSSQHARSDSTQQYQSLNIGHIAPNMMSARVENQYDVLQIAPPSGYNQWPSKPIDTGVNHYHKGGLEEFNQAMDEYQKIKRVQESQLHAGYDDLPSI